MRLHFTNLWDIRPYLTDCNAQKITINSIDGDLYATADRDMRAPRFWNLTIGNGQGKVLAKSSTSEEHVLEKLQHHFTQQGRLSIYVNGVDPAPAKKPSLWARLFG